MAGEVSAAQIGEHITMPVAILSDDDDLVCDRVAAKIMCRCLGCCFLLALDCSRSARGASCASWNRLNDRSGGSNTPSSKGTESSLTLRGGRWIRTFRTRTKAPGFRRRAGYRGWL